MNQTKSYNTHSDLGCDCWLLMERAAALCNNILCMVSCCPLFIVILWRMPAGPACDSFIGSSRWAGASLDISGSRDQSGIQHYSLLLAIRTHRASYWHYQDCLGSYLMIHDASPNIYRFLFLYLEYVRSIFKEWTTPNHHKDCIYFDLILLFLDINVSYHWQTLFNRYSQDLLICSWDTSSHSHRSLNYFVLFYIYSL